MNVCGPRRRVTICLNVWSGILRAISAVVYLSRPTVWKRHASRQGPQEINDKYTISSLIKKNKNPFLRGKTARSSGRWTDLRVLSSCFGSVFRILLHWLLQVCNPSLLLSL